MQSRYVEMFVAFSSFWLVTAQVVICLSPLVTIVSPLMCMHIGTRSDVQDEETVQEKIERARKRREGKTGPQATSANAGSAMMSPRQERKQPAGSGARRSKKLTWL